MLFRQIFIAAIIGVSVLVSAQEINPAQRLLMPGGHVKHAYDPYAPPQKSALSGVQGKADRGIKLKSPKIRWNEATTVPLRNHSSGANDTTGPTASSQTHSRAENTYDLQILRAGNEGEFIAGELIVKLKDGITIRRSGLTRGISSSDPALTAILQKAGQLGRFEPVFKNATRSANVARSAATGHAIPDLTRWYKLSGIDKSISMTSITAELDDSDAVAWYEPNYVRRPAVNDLPTTVTDPQLANQWHLQAAHVSEAWQFLKDKGFNPGGSRDVVVAVIDTGIDYNHPDLAANMWTNTGEIPDNGIDDDNDGYVDDVHGINAVANSGTPMDDHGHGTHVAGIIAAQAGNGGIVGVAYNSQVMAIKSAQYSGVLAVSDIVEGINYAVAHGALVINMSYGGYVQSKLEEETLAFASSYAVLVASAGNDGQANQGSECELGQNMYPAAYSTVLGVMAQDQNGDLAQFSNYDCTPGDTADYELMAPGVGIVSLLPNNQYAAWDGTSAAAPIVSGVAALLRTEFADTQKFTPSFIMGQILSTANQHGKYQRLDASTVSDQPQPALFLLENWIFDDTTLSATNDADGVMDAGETVDIGIVLRNKWGAAKDVNVKLSAVSADLQTPDPLVDVLTDQINYNHVSSFSTADNGLIIDESGIITGVADPFRIRLDNQVQNGDAIRLLEAISKPFDKRYHRVPVHR